MQNRIRWGRYLLVVLGLVAWELSAAVPARAQAGGNPELNALVQTGVAFPSGQMRRLRPPTLRDGLTHDGQLQAIQAVLAMQTYHPPTYTQFTQNKIYAPNILVVDDPRYAAGQPGHSIDLWFVVYGKLKTVADPRFLRKQFKPSNLGRIATLTAAELQQRGITPRTIPTGNEWFVHGTFKLLQTQVLVQVQGTARVVETKTEESATMAGQVDRRFDNDATYPNNWQPAPGGVVQNSPTPYFSCGGYSKVTKLIQPAGALLVEYHLVYDEPEAWFGGADILRTKFPAMTDENVRSFRRDVRNAEGK